MIHFLFTSLALYFLMFELSNFNKLNKKHSMYLLAAWLVPKGTRAEIMRQFSITIKEQSEFNLNHLFYFVWVVFGLFTNEYPLFILMIVLGLIPKRELAMFVIDCVLSICILALMLVNFWFVHISFAQLMKDYVYSGS